MSNGVVVTGGGDSVGRAMAEKFLARGDRVHICDVRPDAVAATLDANPGMSGTVANAGDRSDIGRLFLEARSNIGDIDVLVNNVGMGGPRGAVEEIAPAAWEQTLAVNLSGFLYCMQHVIPGMKTRGHGAIVNFSSGSTRTGLPMRTAYVVSKYGVEGLTRNAARELGQFGIRVNAVLPGMIDNERLKRVMTDVAAASGRTVEEAEADQLRYVSMRTKVTPAEVADMVLFLCSEQAKHVTGQLIGVCGGFEWET